MTDQTITVPDHVYLRHAADILAYLEGELDRSLEELASSGWEPAIRELAPVKKYLAERQTKIGAKVESMRQKQEPTP